MTWRFLYPSLPLSVARLIISLQSSWRLPFGGRFFFGDGKISAAIADPGACERLTFMERKKARPNGHALKSDCSVSSQKLASPVSP